jgi:hypothetical protein
MMEDKSPTNLLGITGAIERFVYQGIQSSRPFNWEKPKQIVLNGVILSNNANY